jgi:protein MPE1
MPSVHFRFKSMKDAQRVTFDGTDISVWELKREIMTIMKLGDGKDFDLALYKDNTDEGTYLSNTPQLVMTYANMAARVR